MLSSFLNDTAWRPRLSKTIGDAMAFTRYNLLLPPFFAAALFVAYLDRAFSNVTVVPSRDVRYTIPPAPKPMICRPAGT